MRYIQYLKEIYKNFPIYKLFLLPIIGWLLTTLCIYLDFIYNMRIVVSFFFVWIFFVFSIVTSIVNQRRFKTYDEIDLIKANLLSTIQIVKVKKIPEINEIKKNLIKIIFSIQTYLISTDKKRKVKLIKKIDKNILYIWEIGEIMIKNWISNSEASRIQQFMAQINYSNQKLLNLKVKRTPKILKLFLYTALPASVIILSPWFAKLWILWIFSSMIIAFFMSMLLIIQNKIEKPFDWDIDDIKLRDIWIFIKRIKDI